MQHRIPKLTVALILAFNAVTASADVVPMPAPTASPTAMQKTVGATIIEYGRKKGIAANDPRLYQTLLGASKALAKDAGMVAAGAVAGTAVVSTAPAWVSILASAAIYLGIEYGLPLAVDGIYKFAFGTSPTPVTLNVLDPSLPNYDYRPSTVADYANCSYTTIVDFCMAAANPNGYTSPAHETQPITCLLPGQQNPTLKCVAAGGSTAKNTDEAMQQSGMSKRVFEPAVVTPNLDMGQAAARIPDAEKAKPVSPVLIAAVTEAALKKAAAEPGYQGLPFDPAAMPTPEEIKKLEPYLSSPPKVAEVLSPVPDPATGFSPAVGFGTSPSPTPTPVTPTSPSTPPDSIAPPEGAAKVDLGPDPGVGSPNLEATPTVPQILDPIMNMMPSFKSFAVPSHATVCPKPSFEFAGKTIAMTTHCDLIEANRSSIFGFMLAVYGITSVFIILRA